MILFALRFKKDGQWVRRSEDGGDNSVFHTPYPDFAITFRSRQAALKFADGAGIHRHQVIISRHDCQY